MIINGICGHFTIIELRYLTWNTFTWLTAHDKNWFLNNNKILGIQNRNSTFSIKQAVEVNNGQTFWLKWQEKWAAIRFFPYWVNIHWTLLISNFRINQNKKLFFFTFSCANCCFCYTSKTNKTGKYSLIFKSVEKIEKQIQTSNVWKKVNLKI